MNKEYTELKYNESSESSKINFINNYYTYEIFDFDIDKNSHEIIRKVALNWQLGLIRKGYYGNSSVFFWDNSIKIFNGKVKTLERDYIGIDTTTFKGLTFYVFDFSRWYSLTEIGMSLMFSRVVVDDLCIISPGIYFSDPNTSKNKKKYTENPNYFIVAGGDESNPYFYYLSEWFFSYNRSIAKLWADFYQNKLDKQQLDKENIELYFIDYFKVILESDYKPKDFKVFHKRKDKYKVTFYSTKNEKEYTLSFEKRTPYNFKIK